MMSGDDERDDPPFEFGDVWPDDKPFPLSDADVHAWCVGIRCAGAAHSTRGTVNLMTLAEES